tara:strand:+ start:333 stop:752 length:420 start_codon:yes stop_codon:yes gene_type:complete
MNLASIGFPCLTNFDIPAHPKQTGKEEVIESIFYLYFQPTTFVGNRQELVKDWLTGLSFVTLLSGANLLLVFKVPANKDFLSCSSAVSFMVSLAFSPSSEITLGRLKTGFFCSFSLMTNLLAQKSDALQKKESKSSLRI